MDQGPQALDVQPYDLRGVLIQIRHAASASLSFPYGEKSSHQVDVLHPQSGYLAGPQAGSVHQLAGHMHPVAGDLAAQMALLVVVRQRFQERGHLGLFG